MPQFAINVSSRRWEMKTTSSTAINPLLTQYSRRVLKFKIEFNGSIRILSLQKKPCTPTGFDWAIVN